MVSILLFKSHFICLRLLNLLSQMFTETLSLLASDNTIAGGAKSQEASYRTFRANVGHFNIKIIRHLDLILSHVAHLK